MKEVDAILPAGGRISGHLAAEAGAGMKALIPLGGRTVLERMIAVLRATGRVGRIVVIGPGEVGAHPAAQLGDAVLPEGGASGPANIFRGLEWLRDAHGGYHPARVLIITTDLPFLTLRATRSFLDACQSNLDACVPVIRRQEFEERFPGLSGTYVRLRDGEWTIGCAFLVNPEMLLRNRSHIEGVFAARKSNIAMVRLLGPFIIARFLARRLTVAHIEQRCLQILGCTGAAIRGCAPELAFDIDRLEDYRYAIEHLQEYDTNVSF